MGSKITKVNFIHKLLGVLEAKERITKTKYSNFFKKAYKYFNDEDIKDLRNIVLTDDVLKNVRELKSLNSKLAHKSPNKSYDKNITAYNSFFENKDGYWNIIKKYFDYSINKGNEISDKNIAKNNTSIKKTNLKKKHDSKKDNKVLDKNTTKNNTLTKNTVEIIKESNLEKKYRNDYLKLKKEMDEKFAKIRLELDEIRSKNGEKNVKKHVKKIKSHKATLNQNNRKKKASKVTNLRTDNIYLKTPLFKNFPKNIENINIYIDEVWYPSNDKLISKTIKSKNVGAISGIIYLDEYPNYKLLPKVKTHLRTNGTKAFNDMINNKKVIPFFMPISFPQDLNAQRYYFEVLQVSIKVLLGWVLPQEGREVNVNIYAEHYTGYDDDLDKTELFNGILENLKLTTNRFSRFNISKVTWKGKFFEYIPYADLIGYIGLQHIDFNKKLAKKKSFDDVVINIPISLDTYKRLEKIDRFRNDKDVKNIIDLLIELKNNSLSKYIFQLLKEEFIKDDKLKIRLIEVIESYYLKKIRNMDDLRILYYYFNNLISKIDIALLLYKSQIEIILIKLMYANHEGNPQIIEDLLKSYMLIREKSKKDNRELALYTDLNFIVNLNDQFRFWDSLSMIKKIINSLDFPFYSTINTGKAFSSYGQVLALNGKLKDANNSFINALESFKNADLLYSDKNKELEKTKVYKIVNLINQSNKDAVIEFRKLLKSSNVTIKMIVKSQNSEFHYLHYILVKLLFFFNIDEKLEYLSYTSDFYKNQHPYEVILLYKALLLLEKDKSSQEAKRMFNNSIKIVDIKEHGVVIKLIGLVISLIARIYYPREKSYQESFDNYLKIVINNMPYAKDFIKKIERYAENGTKKDLNDILRILPFNYI